jgi:hypothetical protein
MLVRVLAPLFLAGFLAFPCSAQSQNPPSDPNAPVPATTSDGSSSGSTAPAPKKVWTNDDIPSIKAPASNKRNGNSGATLQQKADPATVDKIRKSLSKLQTQLDDVNKKLKGYEDFLHGEAVSTGSRDVDKGVNHMPVDQQVSQLQEKKKQLEDQISDLYDEARKKGIDPGQLRDTASAGL